MNNYIYIFYTVGVILLYTNVYWITNRNSSTPDLHVPMNIYELVIYGGIPLDQYIQNSSVGYKTIVCQLPLYVISYIYMYKE